MFRPQEISATEARKYFSQIINKVQFSSKSFVIKSYRKPTVRIVREDYIAALEQVLGKKTVNQILQISGNDNLFDATKVIEIKKVFQRRLSGGPPPRPRPQPPIQKKQSVVDRSARSLHSSSTKVAAGPRPASPKPRNNQKTKRVLLLSNGKSYK